MRGPSATASDAAPHLDQTEVERPSIEVDTKHRHADPVAQPEGIARSPADERVAGPLKAVAVVRERFERDEPFGRHFEPLHKQTEGLDSGHHRVHLLARARAEEEEQLELHEFPLGRLGAAFEERAFLAQSRQSVGRRASAAGQQVERPVNGEIGIAADGRCVVAVAVAGQRVVAILLRTIDGPREAAEHGVVHGVLLRTAPRHVEQPLEFEAAFQRVDFEPQFRDELRQLPELSRIGRRMDPPQKPGARRGQHPGHGLVGGEHELFDDLVALRVFHHVRPAHPTIAVEIDLHLGHREFERSAGHPPAAEHPRQIPHAAEQRPHLASHLHRRGIGVGEEDVDLLVAEPPLAFDRRSLLLGMHRNPVGRELDPACPRIPHAIRLQAGEIVGDDLRQHRNHAVRQIDARATGPGLLVERRPLLDEVRHIGDVHAEQPVPAVDPLQRDRVVEVAGVDRVDRHNHAVREIAPAGRHLFPESLRLPAGLGQCSFGKRPGQAELMDHRERVDACLASGTEHLDDHALSVAEVRRKPHHLHDHLVVLANALGTGIADRHRPREIRAVDPHPAAAGRLEIPAYEAGGTACDDLHDLARRPRAADIAAPGEPHADGVSRGGIVGGDRRDVDVTRTVAGGRRQRPDEPIAARGPPEDSDHIVPARFAAAGRSGRGGTARFPGRLPRTNIARRTRTAHGKPAASFRHGGFSRGP